MFRLHAKLLIAATALIAACVTINVYFPAAAAEKAADRIIDDVWGPAAEAAKGDAQSAVLDQFDLMTPVRLAANNVLEFLIPSAQAQVDFDIDTPEIRALTASMNGRFKKMEPFYSSGAIGLTGDAMIDIRDRNLVPLAQRNTIRQLVDAENNDRNALYKAIAVANGHPEWEGQIRDTFAQRWI
ncbi:MAG: DUF1318 domain-containing protein, partial [Gammaproteobacteria bacterium]